MTAERLRANDSVFLQFSGATDVNGNPIYGTGTTDGLAINPEQCSGCALSQWGWRDERWGPTLNGEPLLLRFLKGGCQRIVIQLREDGLSRVSDGEPLRSKARATRARQESSNPLLEFLSFSEMTPPRWTRQIAVSQDGTTGADSQTVDYAASGCPAQCRATCEGNRS